MFLKFCYLFLYILDGATGRVGDCRAQKSERIPVRDVELSATLEAWVARNYCSFYDVIITAYVFLTISPGGLCGIFFL